MDETWLFLWLCRNPAKTLTKEHETSLKITSALAYLAQWVGRQSTD